MERVSRLWVGACLAWSSCCERRSCSDSATQLPARLTHVQLRESRQSAASALQDGDTSVTGTEVVSPMASRMMDDARSVSLGTAPATDVLLLTCKTVTRATARTPTRLMSASAACRESCLVTDCLECADERWRVHVCLSASASRSMRFQVRSQLS